MCEYNRIRSRTTPPVACHGPERGQGTARPGFSRQSHAGSFVGSFKIRRMRPSSARFRRRPCGRGSGGRRRRRTAAKPCGTASQLCPRQWKAPKGARTRQRCPIVGRRARPALRVRKPRKRASGGTPLRPGESPTLRQACAVGGLASSFEPWSPGRRWASELGKYCAPGRRRRLAPLGRDV